MMRVFAARALHHCVGIAVATVVLAAGCGGGGGSSGSAGGGAKADTLVIANAVNVDTLDPAANSVNESIWMTQNIYQRLLQPNANGTDVIPRDGELAPGKGLNPARAAAVVKRAAEFLDSAVPLASGSHADVTGYHVVKEGEKRVFVADIAKAGRLLDWSPKVGTAEGVARLLDWIDANRGLFTV